MKQYTTPEQTAKLIELGFEKTDVRVDTMISTLNGLQQGTLTIINDFSIGELIEILPKTITHEIWWGDDKGKEGIWGLRIDTGGTEYGWDVSYRRANSAYLHLEGRSELVDALYDMVVKLKEEGVI